MKLKIHYPWNQLRRNQAFFVPGLDTDKVRELTLRASVTQRMRLLATPGIKDGLIGVLFVRKR